MKKKNNDKINYKLCYETMEEFNDQIIKELRESNMAFEELLSRVDSEIIKQAFYELKEHKINLEDKKK